VLPPTTFSVADSGYPNLEVLGYSSIEAEPEKQMVNQLLTHLRKKNTACTEKS